MNKYRIGILSISLLIMIAGSYLFISHLGWPAWFGLILILWSYGIDRKIAGA